MRGKIAEELPHLRRFARGLARDRDLADDLVQDCVERALRKEHLFDRSRELRPWLFQMLRNLFINSVRARRAGAVGGADAEALIAQQPAPQNQVETLAVRQILDALQRLPAEQREVILLVCVEEMSYRATAEILDIPIGTVMSRLSRGREALRQIGGEREPPRLRRVK